MTTFIIISWLVSLLLILLSVAFFTLFERNVIGLVHLRLGPNNVFFFGLVQPLLDAFNLLSKFYSFPSTSNFLPYYLSPFFSLSIALSLWLIVPIVYMSYSASYSLLLFITITSLIVFPLLLSGWASNSKYSFIGCLRSIAQSISYEAVFSTLVILLLCIFITYSINSISEFNFYGLLLLLPLWLFCALAESHRAPFDFSESESELVSGFNTEYIGALFAFIFLSEYSTLLVTSFVIVWLFFSSLTSQVILLVLSAIIVSFIIIIIRVTYCRFRYDLLIIAAWKSYLPVSLMFIILYFIVL